MQPLKTKVRGESAPSITTLWHKHQGMEDADIKWNAMFHAVFIGISSAMFQASMENNLLHYSVK